MGLIGEWRASRARRRLADRYLAGLLTPPDTADVEWLSVQTRDRSIAMRELVFARRAIALIVAERDALDDRTASDVSHALADVIEHEARGSSEAGREWSSRWLAYSASLAVRGQGDAPAVRMARVLLEGAAITSPDSDLVTQATSFVQGTRVRANESLRAVFGVASLPEDVRPSALRP